MKPLLFVIVRLSCLLGLLLAGLPACAATPAPALPGRTIVVGSEPDFPPFATGTRDETAGGFTVELWQDVAREAHLSYTLRVRPFGELLQGLRDGSVDVLLNVAQSEERRSFADFAMANVEVHGAIFLRDGDRRIDAEPGLDGRSVIVLEGDLAQRYAAEAHPSSRLMAVPTAEEGLRRLAAGQGDAMLLTKLVGVHTVRDRRIDGVHALDVPVGYSQRFAIAVRKGDSELLSRIDEALALMRSDGRYAALHEKWFGGLAEPLLQRRQLRIAGTAAALAALAVWAVATTRRRRRDARAAAALRESEERWKFALDGSGDGVWDIDLEHNVTLYSRRWKQMLGFRDSEIGDSPAEWSMRVHPEDLARVMAQSRQCIDGSIDTFVEEYRLRCKDGSWRWVLDRGRVVRRSAEGRALRMIGTHTDIQERKAVEAREAARSQAMTLIATGSPLEAVLESLVGGLENTTGGRCGIVLIEGAQQQVYTVRAPELSGFLGEALDEGDSLDCGPRLAMRGGQRMVVADVRFDPRFKDCEALVERAGARACWLEPIVSVDGRVLGSLATCHREARLPSKADQKAIADAAWTAAIAVERRRAELALRESEERLQRALDASRLALWDLDLVTGSVYLSDAWSEMMGGPREPTTTSFDALGALVPDEDQRTIGAEMVKALKGEIPGYRVEHRVRRPDGQLIWILSQGRVVERGADGEALRAVGTNRDITERKQADERQRELETQLREAQRLEAIGTLAGGIAHDFNNIMAAILGNVALARREVVPGHPLRSRLDQINRAGLRARSLVEQILAFSRKRTSELTSQPLKPLVEEALSMLRAMLPKTVELRSDLSDDPLDAMADATQLQQVLMNLGANAWHALPDGRGRIDVKLDAVELGEGQAPAPRGLPPGLYCRIGVRDNGCGMDEATRRRIFEPFFTTKPVGQGTGLGLSVAHGIMVAHGGAIVVRSAPGEGSTFELLLPLVDHETRPAPLTVPMPLGAGSGQHVLYVDDDDAMALMVTQMLRSWGYRASCEQDAERAIERVRREPHAYDAVVTDYNMPNGNGLDVARAVAAARPGLPVVISTGYISEELRTGAAEAGVHALLQKERTHEELGAMLQSAFAS